MLSSNELLKKTLFYVLKDKYKVHDETLTEKLLTYISSDDFENHGFTEEFLIQWIQEFLNAFARGIDKSVLPFILRFAGHIFGQQHIFIQLQLQDVLRSVRQLIDPFLTDSKLKYCYVAMLEPLSKHKPGCLWFINSGSYKEVFMFYHQQSNIYLYRVAETILVQVPKLIARDSPSHLEEILQLLIKPMVDGDLNINPSDILIVSKILEDSLRDSTCVGKRIIEYILSDGALIPRLESVLRQSCSESTYEFSISELLILSYFADVRLTNYGRPFDQNAQNNLQSINFQLLTLLIKKHSSLNTLKAAKLLSIIWVWFFKEYKIEGNNENSFLFENQIMCIQLTPIWAAIRKAPQHEYFEDFIQNVLNVTTHATHRLIYTFRNSFKSEEEALNYVPISLELILRNVQQMDRYHAVCTFKSIMYFLKEFVSFNECEPIPTFSSNKTILSFLLNSIITLINQFRFTWRETVESMCLFTIAGAILSQTDQFKPKKEDEKGSSISNQSLDKRICVQALNLLREATLYSMQPDLALVTNRVEGSPMELVGPMLLKTLVDSRWEIRDSSLEFLRVLLNISESKFPALQEHIEQYKLVSKISQMTFEDPEPYVRASALVCLNSCLRIDSFWREYLSCPKFIEKLLYLLSTEQEGLVRKEIATWFSELYARRSLPFEIQQKIYLAMYAAARSDLHWEVVSSALGFWYRVVITQLKLQGMLDGTFPSHTFDKEDRKIIILTEEHVRSRLLRALEELGQLGCLTILLTSLDVYELPVVRKAVEILQYLSKYLVTYNVRATHENKESSKNKLQNGFMMDESPSTSSKIDPLTPNDNSKRENVIKDICRLRDIQLLQGVVVENETQNQKINTKIIEVEKMDANKFLIAFYSTNFERMLEDKSGWVSSTGDDISSILQDLLQAPPELDASAPSLDCY